ncbi:MAG: DUF3369 domain-containing protein [Campylobacterota bacterium]|nr:DUF3369 domain-containing protein [Campylobacterota bacterium]
MLENKNDELLFAQDEETTTTEELSNNRWKILVVDDESDVHNVTKLALKDFSYDNKKLEFISAYSAKEAISYLKKEKKIALVLLDVVMETDEAGFEVADYIRKELGNDSIRIILRTGQSGIAPERYVIDNYDINDYKEKTELTSKKLYTVMRTGIKTYKHIVSLENNKKALEYILRSAPTLYQASSLDLFFEGILMMVTNFIKMGNSAMISTINSFVSYPIPKDFKELDIFAATGECKKNPEIFKQKIIDFLLGNKNIKEAKILDNGTAFLPILYGDSLIALIYFEGVIDPSEYDLHILDILASEASVALQNINLFTELKVEHDGALDMLALASEYKDEVTGQHIKRVKNMVIKVAREYGFSEKEAQELGEASTLHDIGKIGIEDYILKKPGKLTHDEFNKMQLHTLRGKEILDAHPHFETASQIASTHHERYDGKGYPNGLKGEDIPISGRITSIVDVFDALTHERPYKKAWEKDEVIEYIKENSGTQFDPKLVEIFLKIIE